MKRLLLVLAIAVAYPLTYRAVYNLSGLQTLVSLMSISFFAIVPLGVGMLTTILCPKEWLKKGAYVYLAPWVPVLIFCLLTLFFETEGWACWVMILPVFLVFASLGGVFGAWLRKKKPNNNKINISLAFLLPLVVSPAEKLIKEIPGRYTAYTSIEITAPADSIWNNVLRVREIGEAEDRGALTNFLGFPRPVKAELDTAAVGGSRKAIFTKGLVFDEVVTEYDHLKKMSFTIDADPYKIPSTAMDEHVVIGGKYFDVLDGTYELEALGSGRYKLHLYSHFEMKTTFNFYAGMWGRWIMGDIQNNILQVIKTRCGDL
jgi:hypothetical protein